MGYLYGVEFFLFKNIIYGFIVRFVGIGAFENVVSEFWSFWK